MPVFTAIGAYVATAVFGLAAGTLAAAVVGGIVAVGAAMLTSRLINGSPDTGGASAAEQASQGTRVQLQPSTENKVPVLYGTAYCNSILTDAYLDGAKNEWMTYVMVISETCNISGATYSVGDIYWNDMRLVFDTTNPSKAIAGKKNVDNPDGVTEDFTDAHFADDDGHVFINVYAGNSSSARQIFGKSENAYDIDYLQDHWDDTYKYQGLVFAVVRVKYNSEKGFTGLPTMTFKVTNSVSNPAAVLADYMSSDRYGANILSADINQTALAAFETWCNENVSYTNLEGTTTTQKRYQINGLVDTSRSVKSNIDTILLNSGAWMSYDVSLGQWRIIPKKELPGTTWSGPGKTGTPTDPAPQVAFSDDNIVGGISISSTRLDNLYNAAEIDYYDRNNTDQRGYVKIALPSEDRNYNEPDNSLRLTFDLCNNNVHAERLANLELKQSRDDLVVTFTTSHYGLQAQAGDVISVYNTLYGWSGESFPYGKYFRVLKTVEKEVGEGSLVNEISALEYNADVYADENITEFTVRANIGIIPRTGSQNLLAPIVTIGATDNTSGTPNFKLNITIPAAGGPYDELQVYVAEGNDWAGTGGNFTVKGQVVGTVFDVIQWNGPNVVRASLEDYSGDGLADGIGSTLSGSGVIANTKVIQFGASNAPYYGNGKTGQYTIDTNHAVNTGIITITGQVLDAKFSGYITGTTLHVTTLTSGTIKPQSLLNATGIANDTVIEYALATAAGDVSTWFLSKANGIGSVGTPIALYTNKPYPLASEYDHYKSYFPEPGALGLFNLNDVRETLISGLPPNNPNKKYFIKARLGIQKEYGPFSQLNEVDLEAPIVYWAPDSQSALNIKTELVKMDFGRFTIPRNGLWLWRTATQLDAGRCATPTGDYFNLDLGDFTPEKEITSEDMIEDFTYDPNA